MVSTELTVKSEEMQAFPNLMKWFTTKMAADEKIAKFDKEMKDALAKI